MRLFSPTQLFEIGTKIFAAAGVPPEIAKEVVDSLVLSNCLGVDSHGVVRIRNYLDSMKVGAIVADAQPRVIRDNGVAVLLDGNKAFGQVVSRRAVQIAIDKARAHAIGVVSFTDVYHIGRLGEYVTTAAEQGFIGLIFANGSRPGGLVAPYGSRERMMGTNPIAFAVPAGNRPPMVADFSTSAVAEGKIRILHRKGEEIPPGWVIDAEGKPTTRPGDLYDGGAILAFGGYKGYALALLVDILGGILSGADTPIFPDYKYMHNGVLVVVIDPNFFRPAEEYSRSVEYLFSRIKQGAPADGLQGALIPGEPEESQRATRAETGIPIDDNTWAELQQIAAELKVDLCFEPVQNG